MIETSIKDGEMSVFMLLKLKKRGGRKKMTEQANDYIIQKWRGKSNFS